MRIKGAFLRTRVARRVLALFALCAMVPIGALAIISYIYVSNQLESQSKNRLRQASKLASDGMLERLHFLETGLTAVTIDQSNETSALSKSLDGRARSLTLQDGQGTTRSLAGPLIQVPQLSSAQREHLEHGRTVLTTRQTASGVSLLLARSVDSKQHGRSNVWAEVEPNYLWRIGDEDVAGLLPDTEICVFTSTELPVYCSGPFASSIVEALKRRRWTGDADTQEAGDRSFEWSDGEGGEAYLAAYRSVFLRYGYAEHDWTVVVSESKTNVLGPMASFKRTFPFVLLLALWFVLLLSNTQIRKSMDPLVELQEGTKRITAKDFTTPVEVKSGDEFEDLAASFNAMAYRLEKQFSALNAINEIDCAVLSARETNSIIDTVLSRTSSVLACDAVSICVEPPHGDGTEWQMVAVDVTEGQRLMKLVSLPTSEADELRAKPDHAFMNGRSATPAYLNIPAFALRGIESFPCVAHVSAWQTRGRHLAWVRRNAETQRRRSRPSTPVGRSGRRGTLQCPFDRGARPTQLGNAQSTSSNDRRQVAMDRRAFRTCHGDGHGDCKRTRCGRRAAGLITSRRPASRHRKDRRAGFSAKQAW